LPTEIRKVSGKQSDASVQVWDKPIACCHRIRQVCKVTHLCYDTGVPGAAGSSTFVAFAIHVLGWALLWATLPTVISPDILYFSPVSFVWK